MEKIELFGKEVRVEGDIAKIKATFGFGNVKDSLLKPKDNKVSLLDICLFLEETCFLGVTYDNREGIKKTEEALSKILIDYETSKKFLKKAITDFNAYSNKVNELVNPFINVSELTNVEIFGDKSMTLTLFGKKIFIDFVNNTGKIDDGFTSDEIKEIDEFFYEMGIIRKVKVAEVVLNPEAKEKPQKPMNRSIETTATPVVEAEVVINNQHPAVELSDTPAAGPVRVFDPKFLGKHVDLASIGKSIEDIDTRRDVFERVNKAVKTLTASEDFKGFFGRGRYKLSAHNFNSADVFFLYNKELKTYIKFFVDESGDRAFKPDTKLSESTPEEDNKQQEAPAEQPVA